MKIEKKKSFKKILEPFDFGKDSPYPKTTLHESIAAVIK